LLIINNYNYLKIKLYPTFKANHFKKSEKNSLNYVNKNNNLNSLKNIVTIYTIKDKIYNNIPSDYFKENFKIKKEYLCLERSEIESLNRDV